MSTVASGPCASTPSRLGELFTACDLDGSGFIDEAELASFCTDLSAGEVADVFRELDKDRDGRISIGEFSESFKEFADHLGSLNRYERRRRRHARRTRSSNSTDPEGSPLSTSDSSGSYHGSDADAAESLLMAEGIISAGLQEHVCELYQSIHNSQLPHLTALFENVVLSVVRDIKQHQYENERLERSYKRDKDQHARHLRQLEEEMEAQMSRVESRVKEEERERYEAEKEELRNELENEIAELTKNIKKLQKMEEEVTATAPADDLKHRVDALLSENRQLRAAVTDASTNLALTRSECTTMRQQLEEKCYELESEKETLLEYLREQESLTRQVHLLQDANKKLHDTNDDLRSALDSSRTAQKRSYAGARGTLNRLRNVDFVSDYVDSSRSMHMRRTGNQGATLADELNLSLDLRGRHMLPSQETCEIDSLPDDLGTDSGHSTLRDLPDLDSEYEPNSIDEDSVFQTPCKRNRKFVRSEFGSTTESEIQSQDSQDEMDTEVDQVDGCDGCDGRVSACSGRCLSPVDSPTDLQRPPSRPCSRASTCSCASRGSRSSRGSLRRQLTIRKRASLANIMKPITKPPERMYKVVLAGDAAVGKSSFIMRLCKGKFVNNISSTLGVDFQTKIIEVDGRVVALQLWDTAGQERFRSIAKSYFRRADGVLLLYDCTYERSFTSVRDWVDAIEDGAQKKIPIMFCGNKTDLRDEIQADQERDGKSGRRVVRPEDGQRLAKDYEGLFIETSAKDSSNILEAVTELARMLRTNEDLEVKSVGMQLQDMNVSENKKMFRCCNS